MSWRKVFCLCLSASVLAEDRCNQLGNRCEDSADLVQMSISNDDHTQDDADVTDSTVPIDTESIESLGPWQAERTVGIPTTIWVTGKWPSDAPETEAIARNLNDASLMKKKHTELASAKLRLAQWAPSGTRIFYFTDDDMTKSVDQISKQLQDRELTNSSRSAISAYFNLRPGAFRADLWRLMILWAYGGVYLDANLRLTQKIETWINFSDDELVLVNDEGAAFPGYWNAMMAASPQSKYLEHAIQTIVENIHNHQYGNDPLAVTGPIALYNALEKHGIAYKDHLRLELKWGGDKKVVNGHGEIMAEKDEGLHSTDRTTYYAKMWRRRHIYCDEAAPEDTAGMCGVGLLRPDAAPAPSSPPGGLVDQPIDNMSALKTDSAEKNACSRHHLLGLMVAISAMIRS